MEYTHLSDDELKIVFHKQNEKVKVLVWQTFVQYNARDTEVVDKMDDKLKFIELVMTIAYLSKCNFKDVYGQVKVWDVFIYNYLLHKKIAVPQAKGHVGGSIEGAYVKAPLMGMKGWVVSFDYASLYPTIMRQWNISPEMLMDKVPMGVANMVDPTDAEELLFKYAKEQNCTIAANGTMFKRDRQGILPEVVEVMVNGRKSIKKHMLEMEKKYQETHDESLVPKIAAANGKQLAYKIMANALYGAAGNAGFRYYDLRIAEAITLTGQACDKMVEKHVNVFMNKVLKTEGKDYVLYMDTDSCYLDCSGVVDSVCPDKTDEEKMKFLIKFSEEVQNRPIKGADDIMFDRCNCFQMHMNMKHEGIFSRGFWTSKKRYALKMMYSEGVTYDPPKIKVMGLDIVKSSTPQVVRKMLKETLPVMFDSDEVTLRAYVTKCREKYFTLTPEDIAFPRGVNNLIKYTDKQSGNYIKGTPMHVRSAILYNRHTKPIREQYQEIGHGDKIKFIALMVPNPIREDVIGFLSSGKFPRELNLEKYVDKDMMWEKSFLVPLRGITDAIGWQVEEKSSLESFFG
jgi:DNA polymerase elongation subunit (family B)